MKILLAVDGSECSDAAARAVGERPWPAGSEIRIVSVVDLSARMAGFTYVTPAVSEMLYDALAEGAEAVIARALAIVRERASPDLLVTTAVMHGAGPAACIVDEAGDWGADLVVVGSHGRGAIGRFLLGSVSSSVVAHAPCSVEVVRCAAASPEGLRLDDRADHVIESTVGSGPASGPGGTKEVPWHRRERYWTPTERGLSVCTRRGTRRR